MSGSTGGVATDYSYVGRELDLFAHAVRWKSYFRSHVTEYMRGDVLEVGAGIGQTTRFLCDGGQRSWLCLEPDQQLAGRLEHDLDRYALAPRPRIRIGTTRDLVDGPRFDTIVYIDVLEHIDQDRDELARASDLLRRGGLIVVLSPAFHLLYSAFDRSVGHYRRYTRRSLAVLMPPALRELRALYLDSAGCLASLANRIILRQDLPTPNQIALWDRVLIPISRRLDPFVRWTFGRSVLVVYERV